MHSSNDSAPVDPRPTRGALRTLAAAVTLAATAGIAQAEVFFIRPDQSGGAPFILQQTIDLAQDGDVIVLQAGFPPFSGNSTFTTVQAGAVPACGSGPDGLVSNRSTIIENKRLTLIGQSGAPVIAGQPSRPVISGQLVISGTKDVWVRGIEFRGAAESLPEVLTQEAESHNVRICGSTANVVFEDCAFIPNEQPTVQPGHSSRGAIELTGGSASLTLSRCDVLGSPINTVFAPKAGIFAADGPHQIAVYDSQVEGGRGNLGMDPGASGIDVLDDSTVYLFGSNVLGGDGNPSGNGLTFLGAGALFNRDSQPQPGSGLFGTSGLPVAPPSAETLWPGRARVSVVAEPTEGLIAAGSNLLVDVIDDPTLSPAVQLAAVGFGPSASFTQVVTSGVLHLDLTSFVTTSPLVLTNGLGTLSMPTNPVAPAQALAFLAQGGVDDPLGFLNTIYASPSIGVIFDGAAQP